MITIKVKDIMSTPVQKIAGDKPVTEAASIMQKKNFGALIVNSTSNDDGIVTERDIVSAVVNKQLEIPVKDIMSSPLITIAEVNSLGEAAQVMMTKNIRRLAVVGEDGLVSGIITIRDVISAIHESFLGLFDA